LCATKSGGREKKCERVGLNGGLSLAETAEEEEEEEESVDEA
jgi:hypothetical protein